MMQILWLKPNESRSKENIPADIALTDGDIAAVPTYFSGYDAILLDDEPDVVSDVLAQSFNDVGLLPIFVRSRSLSDASGVQAVYPPEMALLDVLDDIRARLTLPIDTSDIIMQTVRHMNENLDPLDTLRFMLDLVHDVLPYDGAILLDFSTEYATVKFHHRYPAHLAPEVDVTRINMRLKNFQTLIEQRKPVWIADTKKDPDWEYLETYNWLRSWLGTPILKQGFIIGGVNLDFREPYAIRPAHAKFMEELMPLIGVLVENSQLYDALNEYTVLLSVMRRQHSLMFTSLSERNTLEEICTHIAETVVGVYGKTDCGVMLLNDRKDALVRYSRKGDFEVRAEGDLPLDGKGLVPAAARSGKVIYVPDVELDERYVIGEPDTCSELVIPLVTMSGVIGVIDLQSSKRNAFDLREREGLVAFAEYAAMSIENLRAHDMQQQYALQLEERVAERTQELEDARQRVEAILQHASEGIILLSESGEIQQANPAFYQILGHPKEDFIGQHLSRVIVKNDREKVSELINQSVETHEPITTDAQLIHSRGKDHSAVVEITLTPTVSTSIANIVCTVRDMTQHTHTKRALQRALETQRNLSGMKTQFIRTIHHQFRTPLAVVLSSSELIQMRLNKMNLELGEETMQSIEKHFTKIHREVRGLEEMLSDVLFVNNATSEDVVFQPAPIDIINLINIIIQEVRVENADHVIELEVIGEDPIIDGDRALLDQMMKQMLSNAVKFSADSDEVVIRVCLLPEMVELEVADRGIGIPEKEIDQIFEPFFRGSRADQIPGTGLGLSILKQVTDMHKGTIHVESKEGIGTVFKVVMPRQRS